MFEMKLATCAALMGVLPESTGSLKTSYFSWESNSRAASPKEARGLYDSTYLLIRGTRGKSVRDGLIVGSRRLIHPENPEQLS